MSDVLLISAYLAFLRSIRGLAHSADPLTGECHRASLFLWFFICFGHIGPSYFQLQFHRGLFFLWFFLCFRYLGPSYFQLAADPLTSKFQWASFFYGFSYVLATLGHLTSNLSLTCFQDVKTAPRQPEDIFILPHGVQYVAVRPPPGPRSAGLNPAAALVAARCVRLRCLILQISLLRSIRGLAHSARPAGVKCHPGSFADPKIAVLIGRSCIFGISQKAYLKRC